MTDVEKKEIVETTEINGALKKDDLNESKRKLDRTRKINYVCICFYAFLTGTDFAVIIPTLWDRLHIDFKASGPFLGLVMSSYSISGVLCGLVMGKLSDKQATRTKLYYLFCIFFCILGHSMYFIGISKYLILAARTISGLCLGATTVALAYIAKTSSMKSRTSLISLVMASRQLGLMVGPVFNLFLRKTHFKLFNTFVVDRKSSPGLFMGLVWSCLFFIVLILFKEPKHESKKNTTSSDAAEGTELLEQKPENDSGKEVPKKRTNDLMHFARIEIIVLLLTTFFTYFNQTSLETILIPFTEDRFGWNELHNSLLFCFGGVIIIMSYVLIRFLTMRFPDRFVLTTGVILILSGLTISLISLYILNGIAPVASGALIGDTNRTLSDFNITITNVTASNKVNIPTGIKVAFGFSFLLDVLGLPAIAICSASLFTKLVDHDLQGLGQGIQRGILGVGTILGPLYAGMFVYRPSIVVASCCGMIAVILIFVVIAYRKLQITKT